MLLEPSDAAEFLNGYMDLIRDLSGRNPSSSEEWDNARDEMLKCLEKNPDASNTPMAQAVRQSVSGRFCFLKRYTDHCAVCHLKSNQFYAVRSLTTPIENIIDEFSIVHLCLVPFKGMTVCDGLVRSSGSYLGRNLIKNLRDSYWAAKKEGRLIWDPLQTPKQMTPEASPKLKAAGSSFTAKQGQYLAYIFYYTKIHRQPPSEKDIQEFFQVSAPTVHQMISLLDSKGLLKKTPGKARSIKLLVDRKDLPDLE